MSVSISVGRWESVSDLCDAWRAGFVTDSHGAAVETSGWVTLSVVEAIFRQILLHLAYDLQRLRLPTLPIPLDQHDFLARPNNELVARLIDGNDEWNHGMTRNERVVRFVFVVIESRYRLLVAVDVIVVKTLPLDVPVRPFAEHWNWRRFNNFHFVRRHSSSISVHCEREEEEIKVN